MIDKERSRSNFSTQVLGYISKDKEDPKTLVIEQVSFEAGKPRPFEIVDLQDVDNSAYCEIYDFMQQNDGKIVYVVTSYLDTRSGKCEFSFILQNRLPGEIPPRWNIEV